MEATWGGVMRRLHRTAKRGESCQKAPLRLSPRTRRIDDGGNRHRLDPADRAVVAQHDALAAILDDDPIQTKCLIVGDGRLLVRLGEMELFVVEGRRA